MYPLPILHLEFNRSSSTSLLELCALLRMFTTTAILNCRNVISILVQLATHWGTGSSIRLFLVNHSVFNLNHLFKHQQRCYPQSLWSSGRMSVRFAIWWTPKWTTVNPAYPQIIKRFCDWASTAAMYCCTQKLA